MNKPTRQFHFYLEDIFVSMSRIIEYTKDIDFNTFKHEQIVVDAVIRNF
ncbi:MAG: hypothetical protein ABIJ97_16605 [Bacteroidota bacterium]